jgi:hypothetical protein
MQCRSGPHEQKTTNHLSLVTELSGGELGHIDLILAWQTKKNNPADNVSRLKDAVVRLR